MKRPVVLRSESIRSKVRAQVPDRFLGFAASDGQRAVAVAPGTASEAFPDVRDDRLHGIPHLRDVQEPPRRSIDQLGDAIRRALGGIKYREVPVWHDATLMSDASSCVINPPRRSSFSSLPSPGRLRFVPCAFVPCAVAVWAVRSSGRALFGQCAVRAVRCSGSAQSGSA